jgi:hypothetical protein
MMTLVPAGVVMGVSGTVAMDVLNFVFSRAGIITRIDFGTIGRMAAGWLKGRFRYGHPNEMREVRHETLYGVMAHYSIGVGLAVPLVIGWDWMIGGPVSPIWAVVYGVATTAASWFFVYPCLGFGAFGRRSADGLKAVYSPLANHLFYGLGMAVGMGLAAGIALV